VKIKHFLSQSVYFDDRFTVSVLVLRLEDFSSNISLYNTEKSSDYFGRLSTSLWATLFDKEGLNLHEFITPFIKGGC
jgi:hypothetical protein